MAERRICFNACHDTRIAGKLRIENRDGLFTEIGENKMIFLPKGLYMISDIVPDAGYFEAVVFFFEKEIITDFMNAIHAKTNKQICVSHLVLECSKRIRDFTESLLRIYGETEKPNKQLTRLKLVEFLHLVYNAQQNDCFMAALGTLNNKERLSLKSFMQMNFSKPLGIEDYAYLTGRSLSTFRRDFKAQFDGVSPKQWLIDKRLEKAYELLSKNNTTITDVTAEIGYENIPHFIKAFHKRYSITPKQLLIKSRKEVLV